LTVYRSNVIISIERELFKSDFLTFFVKMKLLAVLSALLGSAHAQCSWSLNTEKGHNEIWYTGSDGDAKVRFIQVKTYGRVRKVSHYMSHIVPNSR